MLLAAAVALLCAPGAPASGDTPKPRPQHVTIDHEAVGELPSVGPRYAPVTIDYIVNLSAHRGTKVHSALLELAERHPRRLRIVYRLVVGGGETMQAEAAMEAFAQGRFLPFLREFLQFRSRKRRPPDRGPELMGVCERAGVDYERLEAAWADERYRDVFDENRIFGRRRHAVGAPALLFNGRAWAQRISSINVARLETIYDSSYARAKQLLDDGVPLKYVYPYSLRLADLAIPLQEIKAGVVDGGRPPEHRGLLENPPLVGPLARRGGHSIGPSDAPVVVRFYCNFLSSYCASLRRSVDLLREYYPTEVRVVFHHMFPSGITASHKLRLITVHKIALCADRQGLFWEFYDLVYQNHRMRANPDRAAELATEMLDLDPDEYKVCMADKAMAEKVMELVRMGNKAGITETPTVVIGGRMYPGSKSAVDLRSLVDRELLPGLLETFAPTYGDSQP